MLFRNGVDDVTVISAPDAVCLMKGIPQISSEHYSRARRICAAGAFNARIANARLANTFAKTPPNTTAKAFGLRTHPSSLRGVQNWSIWNAALRPMFSKLRLHNGARVGQRRQIRSKPKIRSEVSPWPHRPLPRRWNLGLWTHDQWRPSRGSR